MTAELDRLSRALADRYRVERELGAGGMIRRNLRAPGRVILIRNWTRELTRLLAEQR